MNNLDFVKRYIAGTKSGQVKWEEYLGSLPFPEEGFRTIKGSNSLVIMRGEDGAYALIIYDDLAAKEVYRIDEDNLLYDADGNIIGGWNSDDKNALSRLFRLAERSEKRIDELLSKLTMGLPDDDDAVLPF